MILSHKKANFYPVILAGGSGTRFWPRSRKRSAKQVLALDGQQTMIQKTVARLSALAAKEHFWVITNHDLQPIISQQLRGLRKKQIIAEPAARNTAPAIGLAAFLLQRLDPHAVIGLFPADHVIGNEKPFRKLIEQGIRIAASGENIVVMGLQVTRAETGYGYVEAGESAAPGVLKVTRFREKPDRATAEQFLRAGNFYWNSGMFLWGARTLVNAFDEHLPETAWLLRRIAETCGTRKFDATFAKLYPECQNISVDYAILEPRSAKGANSNIYCLPAEIGWNDLGSWTALYEHRAGEKGMRTGENILEAAAAFELDAQGNYVYSPRKFVAVVGAQNVVVVETEDALLVTTRDKAQDVGKVVAYLKEKKLNRLI